MFILWNDEKKKRHNGEKCNVLIVVYRSDSRAQ